MEIARDKLWQYRRMLLDMCDWSLARDDSEAAAMCMLLVFVIDRELDK